MPSPAVAERWIWRASIFRKPPVLCNRFTAWRQPRAIGMQIVYLRMAYKPDLSDSGGPDSPNWSKETALRLMNCRPDLQGKLMVEGTWDFQIVDELQPEPGDLVINKSRYSGFIRTRLDEELRARGIRYLFFTGIATNVCVESTLRHAYFLDYWPILITDAVTQAGPPEMQAATQFNVEHFFGWSVTAQEFMRGCAQTPEIAADRR